MEIRTSLGGLLPLTILGCVRKEEREGGSWLGDRLCRGGLTADLPEPPGSSSPVHLDNNCSASWVVLQTRKNVSKCLAQGRHGRDGG